MSDVRCVLLGDSDLEVSVVDVGCNAFGAASTPMSRLGTDRIDLYQLHLPDP